MGFVTLALQERSSEVWKVLGEVKGEFLQFAEGFAKVQKKFSEAQSSLDAMKTRQNVMQKKMSSIEAAGLLDGEARSVSDEGGEQAGQSSQRVRIPNAGVATGLN